MPTRAPSRRLRASVAPACTHIVHGSVGQAVKGNRDGGLVEQHEQGRCSEKSGLQHPPCPICTFSS